MSGKGSAAKTGAHCAISKTSQMVDTDVLPYVGEIGDEDVVSDYPGLAATEREFLPAGRFPEAEQKWALTVMSKFSVAEQEPHLLRIFYVTVSLQANPNQPETRVLLEVKNSKSCNWEITNLGAPAATFPDAKSIERITKRLNENHIKKGSGVWSGREWDSVLAALDQLTEEELKRIAGVEIRRDRAGSPPSLGGKYRQIDHTIYLYDKGMEHYQQSALGTNPQTMLPASAHYVLHEVGHAIAYAPVREAISKVRVKATAIVKEWGNEAFSFHESVVSQGDFDDYKYQWQSNQASVSQDRKGQFNIEVEEFQKLDAGIDPADRTSPLSGFKKLVSKNKIPAVTPYSKVKGEEDFFCDSFAIWKWYPEWLKQNRKAIYDFFSSNKHLS